jgi:hypothetical protein
LSRLLAPDHTHLYLAQQTVVEVAVLAAHIRRLAEDPALRAKMGRAARDRAIRHYSYSSCLDACLAHWEHLRRRCPERISKEQRKARHPAEPDFAGVFAAWPSRRLRIAANLPSGELRLDTRGEATTSPHGQPGDACAQDGAQRREQPFLCRRSAAGDELYRRKAALFVYAGLERHVSEERIRAMLFLARKPLPVTELVSRLAERDGCGREIAGFCVMWALKHDLLEEAV